MREYLDSGYYIDWRNPEVQRAAYGLAADLTAPEEIAKTCFEFVRDRIKHSWDFQLDPLTRRASDVLRYGTGFCYAKSHLLAALLRANKIPSALCYQRLTISGNTGPFCLHGLNAIYFEKHGWYRVDARGNKPGVAAEFCPPVEKLAFSISHPGEMDIPGLWAEPMPTVTAALEGARNFRDLADHLPDLNT